MHHIISYHFITTTAIQNVLYNASFGSVVLILDPEQYLILTDTWQYWLKMLQNKFEHNKDTLPLQHLILHSTADSNQEFLQIKLIVSLWLPFALHPWHKCCILLDFDPHFRIFVVLIFTLTEVCFRWPKWSKANHQGLHIFCLSGYFHTEYYNIKKKQYKPYTEANWAESPGKGARWRTSPPPLHPDEGEGTKCLTFLTLDSLLPQ